MLVRSLGVRIFELRCLGVRYFGWSPFSGCSDLWASLLGGSEFWVYCILASCLGVRYFGWSQFSGCSDLWASLLGGSEFWVYCILASWVFGFSTLGSPSLCVDVRCGSYGSSVFPWVSWHGGSCFSAVYDASTRLGTFQ
jgi:hypothetical protein